MTGVQPGRDAEVCQDCGHPAHGHEFQASGLCQRCLNGPLPVRPAAPSEPPAEALDCTRCGGTGAEPADEDDCDERTYPCQGCNGGGEEPPAEASDWERERRDAVPFLPCRVYSHGADGWHCAIEGPHEEHRNAAGTARW